MNEDSRRQRRKMWLNKLINAARRGGDLRPRAAIASDVEKRSQLIRNAERDAYRDPENSEVVVPEGHYYDLGLKHLNLHPGVVLHRGLVHIDPALEIVRRRLWEEPAVELSQAVLLEPSNMDALQRLLRESSSQD